MPTTFDRARCARRNRVSALRYGVDAIPLRVLPTNLAPQPEGALRYAQGTLPASVEEALQNINAKLPDGAPKLTAEQVYIHYMEAANDNFVADRYMFLSDKTLRNIAQDAQAGVAFMNSHRTGDLCAPAELPMGRTFAGRYEEFATGRKRAQLGFYMIRGVKPNGDQGPSTDDLHATIAGGTTFDGSVGLGGGTRLCDVCGNDVRDAKLCSHAPGTHRNMTPADKARQKARGVPDGKASYTLHDAHMGEISGVYDGAVPGAGFTKTLLLARQHQLDRADVQAARAAYAPLLRKGDLPMDLEDLITGVETAMTRALQRVGLGGRQVPAPVPLLDPDDFTEVQGMTLTHESHRAATISDPEVTALQTRLAQQEARTAQLEQERRTEQAQVVVHEQIRLGKLYPAENDDQLATVLLAQLMADDAERSATIRLANGSEISRTAALQRVWAQRPAHQLTTEAIEVQVVGMPLAKAEPDDVAASRKAAENYADQANKAGLHVVPAR